MLKDVPKKMYDLKIHMLLSPHARTNHSQNLFLNRSSVIFYYNCFFRLGEINIFTMVLILRKFFPFI